MVLDVSQAALEVTARKRSKVLTSPQDFLNSPPQRGEGKQGDIQSLWSKVRVSLQLCQTTINLAGKQITITGKTYGPTKRHLNCSAMRTVLQGKHLTSWTQAKDQGRAAVCVSAHEASNHWIRGGKVHLLCRVPVCHQSPPQPPPHQNSEEKRGRSHPGH